MAFKPLTDYVLIKPVEEERSGKIQLLSAEVSQKATVIAVGPGYVCDQTGELVETTVEIGDIVMYPKGAGQPLNLNGLEFLILRERDLYGKFES